MSGERAPAGRAPDRYPCPWCELADAWPDACSELAGESGDLRDCVGEIERQCADGDHRRCAPDRCAVSARWHRPVRAAGVSAARSRNQSWAVVSTIPNDVIVVGTAAGLDDAEQMMRTALRNAGRDPDAPESHGLIYLVRASDGALQ